MDVYTYEEFESAEQLDMRCQGWDLCNCAFTITLVIGRESTIQFSSNGLDTD